MTHISKITIAQAIENEQASPEFGDALKDPAVARVDEDWPCPGCGEPLSDMDEVDDEPGLFYCCDCEWEGSRP